MNNPNGDRLNWREGKEKLIVPITSKTRIGLLTDMDGTISPIVKRPDLAQVSDASRRLLSELYQVITLVAVISGRAVSEVVEKVNLPHLVYVGNHGLERWENNAIKVDQAQVVAAARPHLDVVKRLITPQLQEGIWIEDKITTLTIHYRESLSPEASAAYLGPLVQKIAVEQGLLFSNGKMSFEIKPDINIDKGTIVRQLVSEYHLDAAIYLGDDTSDIDAMLALRDIRHEGKCLTVGIGVESSEMPDKLRANVDLLATNVADVEAFLGWFLSEIFSKKHD